MKDPKKATKKLYGYQRKAVDQIVGSFSQGLDRVLCISPCGAGKTEMGVQVILEVPKPRWLWVVHTNTLLVQTRDRLVDYGLKVGIIAGDHDLDLTAPVQVATVQSLITKDVDGTLNPDGIIFDEAHHYNAEVWQMVRDNYPDKLHLGLTATPERSDGAGLGPHFGVHMNGGTYSELIKLGHLVPARLYTPPISTKGLALSPVDAYQFYSERRRTIAFFGRIEEARMWAEKFKAYGVRAECVACDNGHTFNESKLNEFRKGELEFLTSVYMLAEGFDIPDIGAVIIGRRMRFRGTYIQAVGRALRSAPGKKDAIVLDLVGAFATHGSPDEDFSWNLFSQPHPEEDDVNGSGDGSLDGSRKTAIYDMPVTDEGLIRVRHGALAKEDPDPEPIKLRGRTSQELSARRMKIISKKEREIASRKGPAAAKAWAQREMKRAMFFDPTL